MKRVIIIDDQAETQRESILEGFEGSDVELVLCPTKDEGMKWLESKALFDCIVLDWFLEEPESSILSRQILSSLNNKYFAPVLIYTAHAADFRHAKQNGEVSYPENLIREVDKNDFSEIKNAVEGWLNENYTAKLSRIYMEKVYDSVHKTFCDLIKLPHGNIASVYKSIIYEGGSIDWGSDFIINLLLQEVISDNNFRSEITTLITELQNAAPATTTEERKRIIGKLLYHKANSGYIANADIIRINIGEQFEYGIITTPDCDLAQKNTKFVEFIELIPFGSRELLNKNESISTNGNANHFYLPTVHLHGEEFIDLVAVFKSKKLLVSLNNDGSRYPGVLNRVKYDGTFQLSTANCTVEYLCSLVNPYKSEFTQKRNSHDSRVGIPGIYQYLTN